MTSPASASTRAAPGLFYGDADPAVAAAAVARLRPMTIRGDRILERTEAAFASIPSTYVVCTPDRTVPVPSQRRMSAHADEVVEWPTDHSPFLTHPADVADLVERYATA